MRVVVTGGLGYLGSHVVKQLTEAGHAVVTLDRASPTKRPLMRGEQFVPGDVMDRLDAEVGLIDHADVVIHLAALISAPQSVLKPALYYRVNFVGTLHALELARELGAKRFVFASSAAVYGPRSEVPIDEDQVSAKAENPYGASKLFGESLIRDFCSAHGMHYANLRLFNLVGADRSLRVVPTNGSLFSILTELKAREDDLGVRGVFTAYGNQHPTKDGTAVRDFVHVRDVSKAMQMAAEYGGLSLTVNIGSGIGTSVLEAASAIAIKPVFAQSREGELSCSIADIRRAAEILEWRPQNTCIKTALEQEYSIRRYK